MRTESVFFVTFQQLEHLCDGFRVRVGVWTYSDPASAALYRNIKWYDAGEVARISRFKPAFCATFLPGFALVPFADRTMCEMSSSSVASNAAILARLGAIFRGLADRWSCDLLEFNGEPDHVHLLLSVNPKVAPSVLVNNFKTVSSRLVRKEFAAQLRKVYSEPVLWSRSYCVASCGGAPLSVLKQYVEGQAGVESGIA